MGDLVQSFREWDKAQLLGHRKDGFAFALSWLENRFTRSGALAYVIETGTLRQEDNWSGDGQSTRVWDFACRLDPNIKCISVDVDAQACDLASKLTGATVWCADSVKFLNRLSLDTLTRTRVLYLDSFDWSPNLALASALHHLKELTAAWRALPSGCLVMVDDCHSDDAGKHVLVKDFMEHLEVKPVYTGYQTAWVKP